MRPSRSRRRRRLTAAINAASGVVAVGALVAVMELGAPVASNLGLSVGLPSAGHGGTAAQAFADSNFPTLGTSATSVASTTSPVPVAAAPTTTQQAIAYDIPAATQNVTSSTIVGPAIPTAAPAVSMHAVVAASPPAPTESTGPGPQTGSVTAFAQTAGVDQSGQGAPQGHGAGNGNGHDGGNGQHASGNNQHGQAGQHGGGPNGHGNGS